jgi:hypothetical protein
MIVRITALLAAVLGSAAAASAQESAAPDCRRADGSLADTLYVGGEVQSPDPPRPRAAHLGPYPPATEEDFRLHFRDAPYLPYGMPRRMSVTNAGDPIVRVGNADSVPVFASAREPGEPEHVRVWAPITDECVFLPYVRRSELLDAWPEPDGGA